jgi:hypothetical protein
VAAGDAAPPAPVAAPVDAAVVLTARDRVWVRIYEEGGERLIERELAKDERFALPADALDPRINTARPDLIAITVGGQDVAPLSDKPQTMARVPISAAALRARAAPDAAASPAADNPAPRPAVRRPAPSPSPTPSPSASPSPVAAPAPRPVATTQPAPARRTAAQPAPAPTQPAPAQPTPTPQPSPVPASETPPAEAPGPAARD